MARRSYYEGYVVRLPYMSVRQTPGSAEDLAAVMEAAGVTPPGRHQRNHSATSLGISSNHRWVTRVTIAPPASASAATTGR
ncbi:hypothetical protein FJT64_011912 [Amphibalanus amphitrite]|uniref:Uncharacterized protein n=1 Tax=Amphibalanus amphitrite TaxID=1232801 RepID=A0A6A4VHT4_AMPAM|nr:hypothetical protein FJT64_011912 [Amphibalanus amphitrite]